MCLYKVDHQMLLTALFLSSLLPHVTSVTQKVLERVQEPQFVENVVSGMRLGCSKLTTLVTVRKSFFQSLGETG